MSSGEEDLSGVDKHAAAPPGAKKRRIARACDKCRSKKIRCDGPEMPGSRCSNCVTYNSDCTYNKEVKKRGPPKRYVEKLENRLERLENLLTKMAPGTDLAAELGDLPKDTNKDNPVSPSQPATSPNAEFLHAPNTRTQVTGTEAITGVGENYGLSEDEFQHEPLSESMKKLHVSPYQRRFYGKSSGVMLIERAIDLKREYAGLEPIGPRPLGKMGRATAMLHKRPGFWDSTPAAMQWYKLRLADLPKYKFPDDDLTVQLIDLYFENVNIVMPLLHRPTFTAWYKDGLHHRDHAFGGVLMLVCAVASRYCEDPRVFMDSDVPTSRGWHWFEQLEMIKRSMLTPPRLQDLQVYALSIIFLKGSAAPQSCWAMVGVALRLAQDVGAHRRKMYTTRGTVEDEPWKRCIWVLICLDRFMSASTGRPVALQDEDFDIDLPIDCDDEYWDTGDPDTCFKQPREKPSKVSAFICYIKLSQIVSFALRTIYSINKSKMILGFVGKQWEQHIVSELDSALNKWVDAVPDHIRWDPTREDTVFLAQSAMLYATYYHVQILIHRPFIPSPKKPSPLSFPSLAICTNAARSCSHIIEVERRRCQIPLPFIQAAIFTSAIVLLINIWGGKRSGLTTDPNKEMEDVHKCMVVLRSYEDRWHSAGKLWDVLYGLASASELPLPADSPPSNKRDRDSDSPRSSSVAPSTSEPTPTPPTSEPSPRPIAGSSRVNKKVNTYESSMFTLPMYSNELGRLPLHAQDFNPYPPAPAGGSDAVPSNVNGGTSCSQEPPPAAQPKTNGVGANVMGDPFAMDQAFFDQLGTIMPNNDLTVAAQTFEQPFSDQIQAQNQIFSEDTSAMWSTAPQNFYELDDWGMYASNITGDGTLAPTADQQDIFGFEHLPDMHSQSSLH